MTSPPKKARRELKPLSSRVSSTLRHQVVGSTVIVSNSNVIIVSTSLNIQDTNSKTSIDDNDDDRDRDGRLEQVDPTSDNEDGTENKTNLNPTEDDIASNELDSSMWLDRFIPNSREDLGVHPNKVKDVAGWFEEAFNPKLSKYRRVLVLTGPSGAAKTATLQLIAKDGDVDIVEYRNASTTVVANEQGTDRESLVQHFTSFLTRAGMAPALEFVATDPDLKPTKLTTASTKIATNRKRLILLEDLPNTSHYPTKLALRSAIMQYLKSPRVTCPLVVIISEALSRPGVGPEADSATTGLSRDDSVDARSVLGIEVLQAPGCRTISFNPIAPTIMKKALNKLLDKIYSTNGLLSPGLRPSPVAIDVISSHSNGDIRSAVMSLQFLSSNPSFARQKGVTDLSIGPGGGVGKKRKKGDNGGVAKDQFKQLLQYVSSREDSLFIFHALGKVLYSKRWGEKEDDDKKDRERSDIVEERSIQKLPRHLRHRWTRAPSKVDPDVMFAQAPVDSDVFVTYLHHNYVQFTNDMDECSGILDGLSEADALMRMEGEERLSRLALTSQYSFNVAVRSTMLNLPQPVPRRKQTLRKSELWDKQRLQRQNEDGIDEMYRKKDGIALVPPVSLRQVTEKAFGQDREGTKELLEQGRSTEGSHEEGWVGGGGTQRSRKCLAVELIPFVGKIRKPGSQLYSPFFSQLANFPPPLANAQYSSITGEALGEKELNDDGDENEQDHNKDGWLNDKPNDWTTVEAEGVEEILIDPNDDIVDD
ncbi:RFC checkpoint protein Rad17 [Microbotryomycetes sp. JL221]|nr:RFC checkpoint protein Rad17 [Microbotryomycetes sp. JL221]